MAKRLPSMGRTPPTATEQLRASLPPAVVEQQPAAAASSNGRGHGVALQILVPPETLKALKLAAVESNTTVRTVVLEALAKTGYPVPVDEIRDRRRG